MKSSRPLTPQRSEKLNKNPQSIWTAHLKTEEERNDFRKHLGLLTGDAVLKRLKQILTQRLEQTTNEKESYDSPAWAYKQADINGRRTELKHILDLLETI